MQFSGLRTFGGSLIVAGTSIGAGMLALPVVTGPAGFVPSIAVLVACWAFMTITGLLFAELSLWLKSDANILSMAKRTLGKPGLIATWVLYLFLFYSLTIAYMVGGGNLLVELFGDSTSVIVRILIFAFVTVAAITMGKKVIDPVNRLLMIGLFIAYAGFVVIGLPVVDSTLLQTSNWHLASLALPVTFTSFGFQGTVPTLASWMHYDKTRLRRAIVIGTTLTLLMYIVWQWLFLGIVPSEGPNGLLDTLNQGRDAVYPLQYFTNNAFIWGLGRGFAFFALTTSFLGVGIGLVDFLADGLNLNKNTQKPLLLALAFGLPLGFALCFPHVFLQALGFAGGFGCASLLGILPILMVWKAKFIDKVALGDDSLLFKRGLFLVLLTFVGFEMIIETYNLMTRT
ncbi:MAG: amino acid permease [Chlamydiales bacterium]|nr:amino acid permease [Chlamydiales bacterium]